MDFEPSGLKDSIHSFNKYVLSDFYVPLKFGVLLIHTAVSKSGTEFTLHTVRVGSGSEGVRAARKMSNN